jgi:hypothetical protein
MASTSPSSSSCCTVGYTEPGLGFQAPPVRSAIWLMIWYPFMGSTDSTSRIAARTSPRRTFGPRGPPGCPTPNKPATQGGGPP